MKITQKISFFVLLLILLLTSCQPLEPIIPTPTPQPPIESWEGMETGWMSFSYTSIDIREVVYDPQGYLWAVTNNRVFRWDIDTVNFEDLTPEKGFPGLIKNIFLRDDEIWVATSKCIARYLGNEWQIYELAEVDYISHISDTGDRLWASTATDKDGDYKSEYSLYYFEEEKWQEFNIPPLDGGYSTLYSIIVGKDSAGSLWISNDDDDVFRFDGQNWEKYDDLHNVHSIITQPNGSLLFALPTSILIFDGDNFTPLDLLQRRYRYLYDTSKLLPTHDGNLWIQINTGDASYAYIINNGKAQIATPIKYNSENKPSDIDYDPMAKTPSGWVFAGSEGTIYLYDNTSWQKFSFVSADSEIGEIIDSSPIGFTPENNLWILEDGIPVLFEGEKIKHFFSLNKNETTCIFNQVDAIHIDTKGDLWGMRGMRGGFKETTICLFEKEILHPTEYKTYFHANDMALAPNDDLWFVLPNGYIAEISQDELKKGDFTKFKVFRIGGEASQFTADYSRIEIGTDNIVWVIGNDELHSFDGKKWDFHDMYQQNDADGLTILSFATSDTGQVWVGLQNELRHFDGNKWISYRNAGITPYNITINKAGAVWFADWDNGLYKFEKQQWTHFPKADFSSGVMPQILSAPDGAMWFIDSFKWFRYQEKK